jgi:hypothetical protein
MELRSATKSTFRTRHYLSGVQDRDGRRILMRCHDFIRGIVTFSQVLAVAARPT